jgi:chemotaxis protein methyltransferase CheR
MIQDIGIIDTKKIFSTIKEKYNFDFSDYSLTTFKRRVIKVANLLSFQNINDFIIRLEDKSVFSKLVDEIVIDTTEMFRDPPVWRDLRDNYLPDLYKNRDLKIWFPEISSGDELFSLCIVLKETGLLDNTKILVTGISEGKLESIQKGGQYDLKKLETNEANYKRYSEDNQLSNYFSIQNNKMVFHQNLISGVEFKYHNLINEPAPGSFRLIIYRNKLIYYNQSLQDKLADRIVDALMPGGLLLIGNKESLESSGAMRNLNLIDQEEKVFKRKIN